MASQGGLPLKTQGSTAVRTFEDQVTEAINFLTENPNAPKSLSQAEIDKFRQISVNFMELADSLKNKDFKTGFVGSSQGVVHYLNPSKKSFTDPEYLEFRYKPTSEFMASLAEKLGEQLTKVDTRPNIVPKPIPDEAARALNSPQSAYDYLRQLNDGIKSLGDSATEAAKKPDAPQTNTYLDQLKDRSVQIQNFLKLLSARSSSDPEFKRDFDGIKGIPDTFVNRHVLGKTPQPSSQEVLETARNTNVEIRRITDDVSSRLGLRMLVTGKLGQ